MGPGGPCCLFMGRAFPSLHCSGSSTRRCLCEEGGPGRVDRAPVQQTPCGPPHVKCRTAAADGGYAMVAVWKSDLVGSDQLGGGLTLTAGNSLIARFHSLLRRKKFSVPMRREFPCNLLNRLPYLASPGGVTCEPEFSQDRSSRPISRGRWR